MIFQSPDREKGITSNLKWNNTFARMKRVTRPEFEVSYTQVSRVSNRVRFPSFNVLIKTALFALSRVHISLPQVQLCILRIVLRKEHNDRPGHEANDLAGNYPSDPTN